MTTHARSGLPDPASYSATVSSAWGTDTTLGALAHAADDGYLVAGRTMTVAGQGTAAVLELPYGLEDPGTLRDVVEWLRAVPCARDWPGPRAPEVVAVGAFPFDRRAPAFLVVPTVAWCRHSDGTMWRVTISGPDARAAGAAFAAAAHMPSSTANAGSSTATPEIRERPAGVEFAAAVAAACKEIGTGRLSKVVLSRALEVVCPEARRPSALLDALWGGDPIFSPFSLPVGDSLPLGDSLPVGGRRLVGASPELIVSRIGATVTSHPFAGTIPLGATPLGATPLGATPLGATPLGATPLGATPLGATPLGATPLGTPGGDDPAGRLFASPKDRNEHRLLVDEIAAALRPWCSELDVPPFPCVVPLRSDARLGSLIRGSLRPVPADPITDAHEAEGSRRPSALDLLALLHPTPAVGGVPRSAALSAISSLEPDSRGYWAGVAGWVDAAGDGEWVLAIRSAILEGRRATVRAGAGIVEGSDPTAELAETTVKLAPVLDALCPGLPAPA